MGVAFCRSQPWSQPLPDRTAFILDGFMRLSRHEAESSWKAGAVSSSCPWHLVPSSVESASLPPSSERLEAGPHNAARGIPFVTPPTQPAGEEETGPCPAQAPPPPAPQQLESSLSGHKWFFCSLTLNPHPHLVPRSVSRSIPAEQRMMPREGACPRRGPCRREEGGQHSGKWC